MNWAKRILAPGMASFGVLAYLKGNYQKAITRIQRAFSWVPQLKEMPEYSGYLGLSLAHLGRNNEAKQYLEDSLRSFEKITFIDKEEKKIKADLKAQIESVLKQCNT